MTSRAALTVIRHGATLASGLMRSGTSMKPVRAENGLKFAMNSTQLHVHTIRRVELKPERSLFHSVNCLGLLSSTCSYWFLLA